MKIKNFIIPAVITAAVFTGFGGEITQAADIAADREMEQLGYKPDDLIGSWAEKIAGRGYIEISRAGKRTYDVKISWGNSAIETYFWEMTAKADGSNGIRYQNGRHYIISYDEEGHETKKSVYENGRGRFFLNSVGEVMWQDETGHAGDDTVFISTRSRK